jgi:N-acetylmuramoyl-L-alanine amidase
MKLSLVLFYFLFAVLSLSTQAAPLKVLIDPGHGGSDQGAVRGKFKEAHIVLSVAQKLKKILDADQLFQASLTREKDQQLGLDERIKIANQKHADILVSIHANAATDSRAKGFEVYFQNHLPADEESLLLANLENQNRNSAATNLESDPTKTNDLSAIIDDLKRNYKMQASHRLSKNIFAAWDKHKSNLVRQAPFYVISKTEIPSILVELGYVSNPKELARLADEKFQTNMAQKIYLGLKQFALDKVAFEGQGPIASP